MFTLIPLTAVLLVLVGVMLATGWAIAVFARLRRLQSLRVEARCAHAFTGTAIWILAFGCCSYLGYSVREVRWPLAGVLAVSIGFAFWNRPPRWASLPNRSLLVVCLIAGGIAVALVFWPLAYCACVYCACVWPFNDALAYCMQSQWLQEHGMGTGIISIDLERPSTWPIAAYQERGWRMGATFLLSLVRGYTGLDSLLAFPIAMAWGLLLNLAGIFLLARWSFRLPRWASAGAVLAAATAINPLYTSIHQGFLPQMYGTAYFSAVLAVLSRCTRPALWTRPHAFLLALLVVAVVSVYSEMAPILALVGTGYLGLAAVIAWRTKRLGAFARFFGWTLLGLILLGNIEWLRASRAIRASVGAVVGYPIPWSDWEFVGFALGQLPFHHHTDLRLSRTILIGSAGLLFLLGLGRIGRERRSAIAVLGLLVFAGMAVHFRFVALDPITGRVGHYWSLFKIAKWSFPLLLVVQFVGLAQILRRFRPRPWWWLMPGILVLAVSYSDHRKYDRWAGTTMRELTGSQTPVEDWARLNEQLNRLGADKIYLLRPDSGHVPDILWPYVLETKRFVNGWVGCDYQSSGSLDTISLDSETVMLLSGQLLFGGDGERLPGNLTLLDKRHPHLFHVENRNVSPDASSVEIGSVPRKFWIWSPRPGSLRFSGDWQADEPGTISAVGPDEATQTRYLTEEDRLEIAFAVPAGRSYFQLQRIGSSGKKMLRGVRVQLD